jgi:hypothetical protein
VLTLTNDAEPGLLKRSNCFQVFDARNFGHA